MRSSYRSLITSQIDTAPKLLSVAERYNIPKSETAQTKKALEGYLRKLKEAGIDEG